MVEIRRQKIGAAGRIDCNGLLERSVPIAEQNEQIRFRLDPCRHHKVQLSISIAVANGYRTGVLADGVCDRGLEGSITIAGKSQHGFSQGIGYS